MSGSWLEPSLPMGHLASPTCVLIRINYHSQGTPSLKAVLFSWQLCSVCGEWLGGVGLGFNWRTLREGPGKRVWARVACSFLGFLLSGCCPGLAETGGESGPTQVPAPGLRPVIGAGGAQGTTYTSVPSRASKTTGPRPWVGNPGPEKRQGLPAAYPPLSLTLSLPFLDLGFGWIVEQGGRTA